MVANDSNAGSYSIHYRDENTGKPISIEDYPDLTLQNDVLPTSDGSNPNTADAAHQPSIGFVSYLVTGDYFYLEEMLFWTSWNHLWANPFSYRQGSKGIFGVQVRGQAWSLRNLGQSAYALPDDHPMKSHLMASVARNLEYNANLYPRNSDANRLGALESYDGYTEFKPWMDDFYTWTMGYLVDLGFDAVEMRDWKAIFPVGRMGTEDYCYIKGAAYRLVVGTSNDDWWPDFSTLYTQNFDPFESCAPGQEMEGYPDFAAGYPSNLRPALATAVDAGIAGAGEAWNLLITSAVQPDYRDYSNWAVIPRVTGENASPSIAMTASPNPVTSGDATTLSWTAINAENCVASGGWSGDKPPAGSENIDAVISNTLFELTCSGPGGSHTQAITVVVGDSLLPTITLQAAPNPVANGGTATLEWSALNADACLASGAWSGSRQTAGIEIVGPVESDADFSLTCAGPGGSETVSVSVQVQGLPGPTLSFTADPAVISANDMSNLTWSTESADSCIAGGDWSGSKDITGSEDIGPITRTSDFTLTCSGAGGDVTQTLTITVSDSTGASDSGESGAVADAASNFDNRGSSGGGSLGLLTCGLLVLLMRRRPYSLHH
jgi:hypothetical protein